MTASNLVASLAKAVGELYIYGGLAWLGLALLIITNKKPFKISIKTIWSNILLLNMLV